MTDRATESTALDRPAEYVVGLDGCAGGWFAVWTAPAADTDTSTPTRSARNAAALESALYPDLDAVFDAHAAADRLLVDMPIGLAADAARTCDRLVRRRLGARGSSVFPAPCRAVVEYRQAAGEGATYGRANAIQRDRLGSGLPKQVWNITPKIAALDRALRERTPAFPVVESHPEYCFAALNGGYPVAQPKSSPLGRAARFGVLARAFAADPVNVSSAADNAAGGDTPAWQSCYADALSTHYRKHVARDDVIDALVLAAAGRRPLAPTPADPPTDERGLPMRIVSPAIEPVWASFVPLAER